MKNIIKRVAAYLIDIIIVSLVATILTSNSYINKDYSKYEKVYKEYEEYNEEYISLLKDLEKYEEEIISEKNLNDLKDEYKEYKDILTKIKVDETLEEKDLNKIISSMKKHYKNNVTNYSYDLSKFSVIQSIISVLCILMYFVVMQYYFGGETLGKKIMKIKIVSNNEKKLSIFNYLIRSLLLNEVIFSILDIILVLSLSKNNYFNCNQIIYYIKFALETIILFTILFNKNNRGLHDLISNTKVVSIKSEE